MGSTGTLCSGPCWGTRLEGKVGYCHTSEPSLCSAPSSMAAHPTEPQFMQLRRAPPKLGWRRVTGMVEGGSASVREHKYGSSPKSDS